MAMNIARQLVKFPQECMRADRASAIYATFASDSLESSLQYESDHALHVITKESIQGAKKFSSGLGKHGKFNVTPAMEPMGWQEEFSEMKKVDKEKKEKKDDEKKKKKKHDDDDDD